MLKLENTEVWGLHRALVSSGLPLSAEHYKKEDYSDTCIPFDAISKLVKRGKRLGSVPNGSGHDNYLKGIRVAVLLTYPNYFTPQLQRYKFIDIISSTSKMHTLLKQDLKSKLNKWVTIEVRSLLENLINTYSLAEENKSTHKIVECCIGGLTDVRLELKDYGVCGQERVLSLKELYQVIISNCPMGLMQQMDINTNYLQLKTIYHQRKGHKLEDWKIFCKWIEDLPMFKELILKG